MTDQAISADAHVKSGRLSRAGIIQTALAHIDDTGLETLSMRSLANDLGVEAMSLYRYVHGRDDLLEGVTDVLIGDVTSDLSDDLTGHWQGFLQALAHKVRHVAVEHPKAFPLIATRPPEAPWLRPPLRSVKVVDSFLTALIGYGFTDGQTVAAYRAFSSFLIGQLLLESAVHGASVGPDIEETPAASSGEGHPDAPEISEVKRLQPLLAEDRSAEEFEASLEMLLDRLSRDFSQ